MTPHPTGTRHALAALSLVAALHAAWPSPSTAQVTDRGLEAIATAPQALWAMMRM